jgi:hypothetical protein
MIKSKRIIKNISVLLAVFCFVANVHAQSGYGSEKEMKKKADALFEKDDFATALPLYSQLLAIYPKDPEYNFRYGVCNLVAGNDKEKSISYLNYASKNEETDKEVFYYLGRALHLNYRFDEAINNYNIFKTKASAKSLTKLDVNRQIEMCNNGKDLLRNVTDLQVLYKNEFPISEYFRAYDLTQIDTRILVKPEDMMTSFDKKKNDQSVIVQKNNAQEIYFSSYGDDPKNNNRDIYKIVKLPNYTFSKPVKLSMEVNTAYDEEFPYITPDGKTLYFSSKGHNSMGGYDIFKSDYNPETGKYSKPVNLDFAINTPDDDILYIQDGKSDFAYFSSKRSSAADKITVYKVKNQRIPGTVALVKGNFFTLDEKTHQAAKIILKNQSGTKIIGAYNVNPKTGDYQFMVRQGETYLFTVETKDFETLSKEVKIPELPSLMPIKQKANVKHESSGDVLTITTEVETTTSPELIQAAMAMLRERANLEVNSSSEETFSGPQVATNSTNTQTNPDATKVVSETSTTANNQTTASKNVADTASQIKAENEAEKKNDLVDKKPVEITTDKNVVNEQIAQSQTEEDKAGLSVSVIKTNPENSATSASSATIKYGLPNAFTKKDAILSDAVNAYKQKEQEAIAFERKSAEEKEKISQKNDSAKLAEFRRDELQTISAKLTNPMQLEITKDRIIEFNDEADAFKKGAIQAAVQSEQYLKDAARTKQEAAYDKAFSERLSAAAKTNNKAEFEKLYYSKFPKPGEAPKAIPDLIPVDKTPEQLRQEIAALNSKIENSKKDLAKTNDSKVKGVINKRIANFRSDKSKLENELASKSPQAGNPTLEQTPVHSSKQVSNSIADATIYPQDIKPQIEKAKMLLNESGQLKSEAAITRKNAATLGNPTTKNNELLRASALDREARDKELEAFNTLFKANSFFKKQNDLVINDASGKASGKTSSNLDLASELNKQAQEGFKNASNARAAALKEPNTKLRGEKLRDAFEQEKLALQQQRKSIDTYGLEVQIVAASSISKANKPLTPEEINSAFKQSEKFPKYDQLNNEHQQIEAVIKPKKEEIDTLKKTSQKDAKTAEDLKSYAETQKSKSKKESAMSAAVIYEQSSQKITKDVEVKQVVVDSLQTVSNSKKAEADGIKTNFEQSFVNSNAASGVHPIKELDYTQSELDEVISKAAYKKYFQTRYSGDSLEFVYKKIFNDIEDSKNKADSYYEEQESLDKQYKRESDLTKKRELKAASKEAETKAISIIAHADSLYDQAQKLANKIDLSDNKLQVVMNGLDDKSANDYPIIYESLQKKPFDKTRKEFQQSIAKDTNPTIETTTQSTVNADQTNTSKSAEQLTNVETSKDTPNTLVTDVKSDQLTTQNPISNVSTNTPDVKAEYTNEIPSTSSAQSKDQVVKENVSSVSKNGQEEIKTSNNTESTVGQNNQNTNVTSNVSKEIDQVLPVVSENGNSKPVEGLDYTLDEINNMRRNPNYVRYYRNKYKGDSLEFVYNKFFKKVESNKMKADKIYEEKDALNEELQSTNDSKRKAELKKLIKEKDAEADVLIDQADSMYVAAEGIAKKIKDLDKDLQSIMNALDDKSADEYPLIYAGMPKKPFDMNNDDYEASLKPKQKASEVSQKVEVKTTEPLAQNNLNTSAQEPITEEKKQEEKKQEEKKQENANQTSSPKKEVTIPTNAKLSNELENQAKQQLEPIANNFNTDQQSLNTEIPLDVQLPKGIVFKVQIGAFKRRVTSNAFGGVSPLSGETSKTGMIRYSAGLFKEYAQSNAARRRIAALGFNDAYVIAFCNGKRIEVSTARKLIAQGLDCESGSKIDESIALEENNIENQTDEERDILKTQKNLKKVAGLLYTVQVGVYKRLIPSKRLSNLNELYFDTLKRGLIRYTHGIFDNRVTANAAKNRIVEIGIKDAFVIPYFNKRYISAAEAERLIKNDVSILVNKNLLTLNTNTNGSSTDIKTNTTTADISKLRFKVQLGVFRKSVPIEIMSMYLKLASKGIEETKIAETTVYSIGNYDSYEAANAVKTEALSMGVTDAFVAAYNDGKKIALEEALRLLGKK